MPPSGERWTGARPRLLVNDSHGDMRNLLPEDLDGRARLITHSFKRVGLMKSLDESFDAVLFIGYHAQAGSPRGRAAYSPTPARTPSASR